MSKDALAKKLQSQKLKKMRKSLAFLVGFDGFTDEIIACVDRRTSATDYVPFKKIADFADHVHQASGKSKNFEFVVKQKKIGGNGPILANALLEAGCSVSLIGALGVPEIEELFLPLTKRCDEVFSIASSGHSDAVEFLDGKLILGKHDNVRTISHKNLEKNIGKKKLIELFDKADLFVSANWTMIVPMTDTWNWLIREIFPHIKKKTRIGFFDLADPAKRSPRDLQLALKTLSKMQKHLSVHLGLNVAESEQVAKALGYRSLKEIKNKKKMLCAYATWIRKQLDISQVVIHATDFALSASSTACATIDGPYCVHPKLSTGGGDNFNAGYCFASALELTQDEALLLGSATSGYYVRNAKSPTLSNLIKFLKDWEQEKV